MGAGGDTEENEYMDYSWNSIGVSNAPLESDPAAE